MKQLTAFVLLLLSVGNLHAQTNLDSLWNIWQDESQPDTTRLNAIRWYAWDGYLYSKPDSAFYFAQLQYDFAQSRSLKNSAAAALNTQGASFFIRGNNPKALDYFQRGLKIKEEEDDKPGIANSLNNIGLTYYDQGNYPRALDYFQRGLKISEEIGDKMQIARTNMSIGLIYKAKGDYADALDYYEKSLKIKEEIGNKLEISASLTNIGSVYYANGDYARALDYYQKSLKIKEEIEDKRGMASCLTDIGNIYKANSDYAKALDCYQKSLKMNEEIEDKREMAISLNGIGNLYRQQGEPQNAIAECDKGWQLAQQIGAISIQKEACQCLYHAYKSLGNGNKALEYHEQMLVLDDSLKSQETTKKLEQMEFQKKMLADSMANEEEKLKVQMAHEADVRKKKRSRNLFLGGGLLVLLLAGGLYSRNRYIRKSRDEISKEKDRSENLLLNILPAEIAEELKEKGRAEARDFDMVSILFTDFKEFTQTSEKLSAQELVGEINVCFEAFDTICSKYGIEKIKTIGDAYMAAGGLPVPDETAARDTVMAAIEMQQFMIDRREELEREGKQGFQMRVGIHTGPVVAGIVGVKKFQYDIWGDTVNTASRMESHGEVGKVNISQDTYELIKDGSEFNFEPRGKLEVKGKGEVEMYFASRSLG